MTKKKETKKESAEKKAAETAPEVETTIDYVIDQSARNAIDGIHDRLEVIDSWISETTANMKKFSDRLDEIDSLLAADLKTIIEINVRVGKIEKAMADWALQPEEGDPEEEESVSIINAGKEILEKIKPKEKSEAEPQKKTEDGTFLWIARHTDCGNFVFVEVGPQSSDPIVTPDFCVYCGAAFEIFDLFGSAQDHPEIAAEIQNKYEFAELSQLEAAELREAEAEFLESIKP